MKKYECEHCSSVLSVPDEIPMGLYKCSTCQRLAWHEVKEKPAKKHESIDSAPMIMWECKSYRNCDHRARCLCMVEAGKKPSDSAGCGEGNWREIKGRRVAIENFPGMSPDMNPGPITCPDCKDGDAHIRALQTDKKNLSYERTRQEEKISQLEAEVERQQTGWSGACDHAEQLRVEAIARDKEIESLNNDSFAKGGEIRRLKSQLPVEMQNCTIKAKTCNKGHLWLTATNWVQYGCPTCLIEAAIKDGNEEIKELQGERDKYKRDWNDLVKKLHSQACEITQLKHGLECSKGADSYKYKRIEELEAKLTSLKDSLSDVTELAARAVGLDEQVKKLGADLEAERKKKATLTLMMDRDQVDSFLAAFPGFKIEEPK